MKRHDVVGAPVGFGVVRDGETVPDQELGVAPRAVRDSNRVALVKVPEGADDDGPLAYVVPTPLPVFDGDDLPAALAGFPVVVRAVQDRDQDRVLALLGGVRRLLAGNGGVERSAVYRRDRPAKRLAEKVRRDQGIELSLDRHVGQLFLDDVPVVLKVLGGFARQLEDVRPLEQLLSGRVVPPRRRFVEIFSVQEPVVRRPRAVLDRGSHVQRVEGHPHGESHVPSGHAEEGRGLALDLALDLALLATVVITVGIALGFRRCGVRVDERPDALVLERACGGVADALGDAEDDLPVLDWPHRAQTPVTLLI